MIASQVERVADLRQPGVPGKVVSDLDRRSCFITIRSAGTFELKAAIIGNVYLLIGVIDQEYV